MAGRLRGGSVKVILFDVYKTLLDIRNDEKQFETYQFISTWLSYKGVHIEAQAFLDFYKKYAKDEMESNPEPYPDIDVANVFRRIISSVKELPTPALDEIVIELGLLFRLLTTTSLTIFPETKPLLDVLSNHYRLGIASNTQRIFTLPELKKFGLERYFESIVFSSDVRACKPNEIIFQRSLNEMGATPDETVFIGDNLLDDIWGAQQVGMKTVWIDRGEKVHFPESYKLPTPNIRITGDNLLQLPEMLEKL